MEITTQAVTKIGKNKLRYWFSFIAVVLLFSGIAKIIDPLPLIETLKLVTIIPYSLQIIIATLLPVVEIGLGVLMIMKICPTFTLTAVTTLFAFFLGFSVYGTVVGFGSDCGYLPTGLFKRGLGKLLKVNLGRGWFLGILCF